MPSRAIVQIIYTFFYIFQTTFQNLVDDMLIVRGGETEVLNNACAELEVCGPVYIASVGQHD